MKLNLVILAIIAHLVGFSQAQDSLIVKNLKTKQEYTIQPWHDIIVEVIPDTTKHIKNKKFYGTFIKQSTADFWIDASMQKIKISLLDTNGKYTIDSTAWVLYDENNSYDYSYEYQKVKFAKTNCQSIRWDKTPGNRILYQLLTSISLSSALMISPLISVNYKTWDFNTKKFLRVSSVSMVTATISFSLYKTAGVKSFNFSNNKYVIK